MNFSCAVSPDGTRLALWGSDKRGKPSPDSALRVYDLTTRKPLWTWVNSDEYQSGPFRVRYTPDGKHLITSANDLRVWEAATGAEINRVAVRGGYPEMALSPDGTTVAAGERLVLWEWQTKNPPRPLNFGRRDAWANYVAFSADGKTVYKNTYTDRAHGYDVATGDYTGEADEAVVRWRAPSPDGQLVAVAGYDKAKREGWVSLRDAKTEKEVRRLPTGGSMISHGSWSKDGTRLAGATAFRAVVWDVATGRAMGPDVPGHAASINALTFLSDGRLVTAGDDATVRAWDPKTGKELVRLRVPGDTPSWHLAASPDGSLLATAVAGVVRVWDAKTGAEVYQLTGSDSKLGSLFKLAFSADDQTLTTYGNDWSVRVWDLATGKVKIERPLRPAELLSPKVEKLREAGLLSIRADLGPDGDTLVVGVQKDVALYSVTTGKLRWMVETDEKQVELLALSPDGKHLATSGAGPEKAGPGRPTHHYVAVWDLTEGKRISRFRAAGWNFYRVFAFSPDGKWVVTGAMDEVLRVWDAATGAAVGELPVPRTPRGVAFSPDGKWLAVSFTDPTVLVYDVAKALRPAAKP